MTLGEILAVSVIGWYLFGSRHPLLRALSQESPHFSPCSVRPALSQMELRDVIRVRRYQPSARAAQKSVLALVYRTSLTMSARLGQALKDSLLGSKSGHCYATESGNPAQSGVRAWDGLAETATEARVEVPALDG